MPKIEHKPLPYAYDALEPHIDARTMEIHHGKHYKAYVDKYNDAVAKHGLEDKALHELLPNDLAAVPDDIKTAVRNNGGGAHNHALFWEIMGPDGGGEPKGELASAIDKTFGSFDAFKSKFNDAAATRFGSGWAWLIKKGADLEVISTPNQDSPLMMNAFPVMGLDVWEHAYYLNYQNKRPDYINAFWNVVNWEAVGARYDRAE
ncbi:MAG: superoxide dismutase [Planctomycetota bacterium]